MLLLTILMMMLTTMLMLPMTTSKLIMMLMIMWVEVVVIMKTFSAMLIKSATMVRIIRLNHTNDFRSPIDGGKFERWLPCYTTETRDT